MAKQNEQTIKVPPGYPASHIYIDESGTASNGRFFVVACIKVRRHGELFRAVRSVRDQHGFLDDEFRFNKASLGRLPVYCEIIETIQRSGTTLAACVVDRARFDPFTANRPKWDVHADVTAQLLRGCIGRRELTAVSMDLVTTPPDIAIEDEVRNRVNRSLRNLSVVTAACLDSRSSDGLQIADLVAGAIAFERRRAAGLSGRVNSHKAKVARRLMLAFDFDGQDGRTGRTNVATYRGPARRRSLSVIGPSRSAS